MVSATGGVGRSSLVPQDRIHVDAVLQDVAILREGVFPAEADFQVPLGFQRAPMTFVTTLLPATSVGGQIDDVERRYWDAGLDRPALSIQWNQFSPMRGRCGPATRSPIGSTSTTSACPSCDLREGGIRYRSASGRGRRSACRRSEEDENRRCRNSPNTLGETRDESTSCRPRPGTAFRRRGSS